MLYRPQSAAAPESLIEGQSIAAHEDASRASVAYSRVRQLGYAAGAIAIDTVLIMAAEHTGSLPATVAVTAGIGVATAYVPERRVVNELARKRTALSEDWGVAAGLLNPQKPSTFQRLSRGVISPLTLTAGIAGGLFGMAIAPGETVRHQPATLEVVVDHSKATTLGFGGKPATDTIDSVVESVQAAGIKAKAQVAHNGIVVPMTLADALADKKYSGGAPLDIATKTALSETAFSAHKAAKADKIKRTGSILLITNNNVPAGLGDLETTAAITGTRVFVVDVANKQVTAQASTKRLKTFAQDTGGQYWSGSGIDPKQIASEVQKTMAPPQETRLPRSDRNAWYMFAGFTTLAAFYNYRRRKDEPTYKGPKGE